MFDRLSKIFQGYNNWRKQWEVPAGKRELGETIIETAKREFLEETHQKISKIDLRMVAEIENENRERRYRAICITEINSFLTFKKRNDDEMDRIEFFEFSELEQLNFDGLDLEILKSLIKEVFNVQR